MSNHVRTALIGIVAAVWAANFTAPIFVPGYAPPEGVHVAFMAIVGILTAGYREDPPKRGRKGEDDS